MCEESGINIVRLEPYGGVPEILVDVSAKCLATKLPSICGVYVALSSIVLNLKPMRSISRNTKRLFPMGYVLVANKSR